MPTNSDNFDIGTAPTIIGTFRNINDVPADPSTVVVQYRTPSGTQSTLSASNTAVGVYEVLIPVLLEPGIHSVRFVGTGVLSVADTVTFRANKTSFITPP